MPRQYTKKSDYWKKFDGGMVDPLAVANAFDRQAQEQDLGEHREQVTELHVTDGKSRGQDEIDEVRALEELIGISSSNPFKTVDADVFEEELDDMSKTDLQHLCNRVGVPPRNSRVGMQETLRKEFKAFRQKHGVSMPGEIKPVVDPSSPHYKEVVRLLEE